MTPGTCRLRKAIRAAPRPPKRAAPKWETTARDRVPTAILTNGQVWQVWHLTGGLPVVVDLTMEVDLLGDATPTAKADALFHLGKEAVKHRLLDELWQAKAATSPRSLARIVLSENAVLRTELEK